MGQTRVERLVQWMRNEVHDGREWTGPMTLGLALLAAVGYYAAVI